MGNFEHAGRKPLLKTSTYSLERLTLQRLYLRALSPTRSIMSVIEAIILAIVEGITEYLPVSSTGHLIIANSIMGIQEDEFAQLFIIVIQFGAILSVVVLYWKRFFAFSNWKSMLDFYFKLLVAFIPAVVVGLLLKDQLDRLLSSATVVGFALLAGGIFLLFADRIFRESQYSKNKPITFWMALKIGLFQVIAMIPGVSRSAAVIVGGLAQKLNRRQAAEFSFFLAVPTLFAASVLNLQNNYQLINQRNIDLLLLGSGVSFIVAMIAIKTFIDYLARHGFAVFGWYRIALGATILILKALGISLTMV